MINIPNPTVNVEKTGFISENFHPVDWPEVMEDYLDPRQLVWVVTEEEEATVYILVVTQHFHDRFDNHFNNIGLFNQLSSLKVK